MRQPRGGPGRRLTRGPHCIQVRYRPVQDIRPDPVYGQEVRYRNVLVSEYVTCGNTTCTMVLLGRAGISSGVDAYVGPVYVGSARYVHVVALPGERAGRACTHCGTGVPTSGAC